VVRRVRKGVMKSNSKWIDETNSYNDAGGYSLNYRAIKVFLVGVQDGWRSPWDLELFETDWYLNQVYTQGVNVGQRLDKWADYHWRK